MSPAAPVNCGTGAQQEAYARPPFGKPSKQRNTMPQAQIKPAKHLARWVATIYYRTKAGLIDVQLEMEELEELQGIVESGPNWYALERIEIRHAFQRGSDTIEKLLADDHR